MAKTKYTKRVTLNFPHPVYYPRLRYNWVHCPLMRYWLGSWKKSCVHLTWHCALSHTIWPASFMLHTFTRADRSLLEPRPARARVWTNSVRANLVDVSTNIRVLHAFIHVVVTWHARPPRQTDTPKGVVTAVSAPPTLACALTVGTERREFAN